MNFIIEQSKFTFHPVGQGLFYSGNINNFNFVYDCGSVFNDENLTKIVNEYSENTKEIDVFILSHFHYDHINGLLKLKEKIKIKTFILPYISPIIRLAIALSNNNRPSYYYKFLANPVSFIKSNYGKNCKIIFINRNDDEIGIDYQNINNENNLHENLSVNLQNNSIQEEYNNTDVIFKTIKGYISYNYKNNIYWLFYFYQRKVNKKIFDTFHKEITRIIKNKDIISIITDKTLKKPLINTYKQLSEVLDNNINNTSLVLLHKPVNQNNCAQILTGDISLNSKSNDILKDMKKHFDNKMQDVIVFQIPHHGSKNNWNNNVFKYFNNAVYFVASNDNKHYGHPDFNIIISIISKLKYYFNPYDIEDNNFSINLCLNNLKNCIIECFTNNCNSDLKNCCNNCYDKCLKKLTLEKLKI